MASCLISSDKILDSLMNRLFGIMGVCNIYNKFLIEWVSRPISLDIGLILGESIRRTIYKYMARRIDSPKYSTDSSNIQ